MKKLLLAGLAGLALGGIDFANAADIDVTAYPTRSPVIAPPRDFEWFGPYVGAIVGGGLENTKTDYSYSSTKAKSPPGFEDIFGPPSGPLNVGGGSAVASAIAQGFLPTSIGKKEAGFFTAGGQIGLNFQMAQVVFGIEGDFEWMSRVRSTQFVAPPNGFITNTTTQTAGVQWLSTFRARAGYAIYHVLIFATGGGAIGRVIATTNGSGTDGTNTDLFSGGGSQFKQGFVVGGGIEYALTNYLTLKAEYLFYNLGTVKYQVPPANAIAAGEGLFINASQKFDGNIFRVGLNFKPDWL